MSLYSPCVCCRPRCELVKHLDMLLQCYGPIVTSGLMIPPPMFTHLVMLRTGSVSAPCSTKADCASSTPASATPVVMEPHASQSLHWRLYVCAPTENKVYCVTKVSVTALHRSMQRRFSCFIERLICKELVSESWLLHKRINEHKLC